MWKTIESSTEETRMGKTKERRSKEWTGKWKRIDRVTKEKEEEKEKDEEDNGSKEASKGME